MLRGADAVLAGTDAADPGDLVRDLRRRQHPAEARLGALGELDLERPDRSLGQPGAELVEAELAVRGATAEVARADLEDQLPAVAMGRRQASLPGVLQAGRQRRSAVDGLHGRPGQRAVAHRRGVHRRRGPEGMSATAGATEDLRGGQQVLRSRSRGPRRRRRRGERLLLEHRQGLDGVELVVGPEPEGVLLPLRRRVDPAPLVPRERPLLVVGGDDVLPKPGARRFEREARVPDEREVAQDRVASLQHVVGGEPGQGADAHDRRESRAAETVIAWHAGPTAADRDGHGVDRMGA